jgi:mismatch-specific thymine-DNA glycosylase
MGKIYQILSCWPLLWMALSHRETAGPTRSPVVKKNGATNFAGDGFLAGLPDYLEYNLKVLFVGYNPGERSALLGNHYAGRGNQFWRLLYEAGLTDRLYLPAEDHLLPSLGYGLTNLAVRPSKSSSDLSGTEKKEGAAQLRKKVARYRPGVVCLLGKEVYRWYAGKRAGEPVQYGPSPAAGICAEVMAFVAPNPSGRSTIPYSQKLRFFRLLKEMLPDSP